MRLHPLTFAGIIIVACACGRESRAALVVNAQSGTLFAAGTGGQVSLATPALAPWTQSAFIGTGAGEWLGSASATTNWDAESIEIHTGSVITPGVGVPVWTASDASIIIDFTFTETTDTFVRFEFSASLGQPPIVSASNARIIDLATGNEVPVSGTFVPTTFAPGNYRLQVFGRLGNLESSRGVFESTNSTSFGGIYVLPSPGVGAWLLGGLSGVAMSRRRQ